MFPVDVGSPGVVGNKVGHAALVYRIALLLFLGNLLRTISMYCSISVKFIPFQSNSSPRKKPKALPLERSGSISFAAVFHNGS